MQYDLAFVIPNAVRDLLFRQNQKQIPRRLRVSE